MTAFRFNHAELNRIAREAWGLRWPVNMKRRKRRYDHTTGLWSLSGAGWHCSHWRPTTGERWHEIRVESVDDTEFMLRTLAHELEHARMNEVLGIQTHSYLYNGFGPSRRRLGWRRGPVPRQEESFERRAIAAEDRWRELLGCVRYPRTEGAA